MHWNRCRMAQDMERKAKRNEKKEKWAVKLIEKRVSFVWIAQKGKVFAGNCDCFATNDNNIIYILVCASTLAVSSAPFSVLRQRLSNILFFLLFYDTVSRMTRTRAHNATLSPAFFGCQMESHTTDDGGALVNCIAFFRSFKNKSHNATLRLSRGGKLPNTNFRN